MADFVAFGQAAQGAIRAVAGNLNEDDTAAFLALQQDTIQNAVAEARRSGTQVQGAGGGQGQGAGKAGQVSSAMELLKARMKK